MTYENRLSWKKKDDWSDDFARTSCAYCDFDCYPEVCDSNDYYCDNFIPRID